MNPRSTLVFCINGNQSPCSVRIWLFFFRHPQGKTKWNRKGVLIRWDQNVANLCLKQIYCDKLIFHFAISLWRHMRNKEQFLGVSLNKKCILQMRIEILCIFFSKFQKQREKCLYSKSVFYSSMINTGNPHL